jgi:protein-S-isoprenylcysteine O-methyltransferase Ste14
MPIHLPHVRLSIPMLLSAAEWAVFTLYWSVAAKNSSPAKSAESRNSRRVHELLVNLALLLVVFPVPGSPSRRFLPDALYVVCAGLCIQTASGMLGVWARRHLGSNWSGEIAIKVDHRLIRSGPYRFVRHPIYTAMLGMFVGTAIVSGQLHAALGLAMAVFAYWRKIRLEEANLRKAFATAYDAYRRDTGALVPRLL